MKTSCLMISVANLFSVINKLTSIKNKATLVVALLFVTFASLLLSACTQPAQQVVLSGKTMGTTWSVKVVLENDEKLDAAQLQSELDASLKAFNQVASTWLPNSDISLFNANKSLSSIAVDSELAFIIAAAKTVHKQSNGNFDITVSPLIDLWGFGSKVAIEDRIPSKQDIDSALAQIGSDKINVIMSHQSDSSSLIKQQANLQINLSAIAKGRAVDLVADQLDKLELKNYMVEIGGEISAQGYNSKRKAWRIAIEKPLAETRTIQKAISLKNTAMATSGDYRNFFEIDGQRYSHSITPNTGWPVKHQLVSVTVLHQQAMIADAWATALIVAGPEHALQLAKENNLAVLLIERAEDGFKEIPNQQFTDAITAAEK